MNYIEFKKELSRLTSNKIELISNKEDYEFNSNLFFVFTGSDIKKMFKLSPHQLFKHLTDNIEINNYLIDVRVYRENFSSLSYGAQEINRLLRQLSLYFETEYTFNNFKSFNGGSYRYDFAILSKHDDKVLALIEFDGCQHGEPVDFYGGVESFETRKIGDNVKNLFAKEHNIPLLRINQTEFDNNKTFDLLIKFLLSENIINNNYTLKEVIKDYTSVDSFLIIKNKDDLLVELKKITQKYLYSQQFFCFWKRTDIALGIYNFGGYKVLARELDILTAWDFSGRGENKTDEEVLETIDEYVESVGHYSRMEIKEEFPFADVYIRNHSYLTTVLNNKYLELNKEYHKSLKLKADEIYKNGIRQKIETLGLEEYKKTANSDTTTKLWNSDKHLKNLFLEVLAEYNETHLSFFGKRKASSLYLQDRELDYLIELNRRVYSENLINYITNNDLNRKRMAGLGGYKYFISKHIIDFNLYSIAVSTKKQIDEHLFDVDENLMNKLNKLLDVSYYDFNDYCFKLKKIESDENTKNIEETSKKEPRKKIVPTRGIKRRIKETVYSLNSIDLDVVASSIYQAMKKEFVTDNALNYQLGRMKIFSYDDLVLVVDSYLSLIIKKINAGSLPKIESHSSSYEFKSSLDFKDVKVRHSDSIGAILKRGDLVYNPEEWLTLDDIHKLEDFIRFNGVDRCIMDDYRTIKPMNYFNNKDYCLFTICKALINHDIIQQKSQIYQKYDDKKEMPNYIANSFSEVEDYVKAGHDLIDMFVINKPLYLKINVTVGLKPCLDSMGLTIDKLETLYHDKLINMFNIDETPFLKKKEFIDNSIRSYMLRVNNMFGFEFDYYELCDEYLIATCGSTIEEILEINLEEKDNEYMLGLIRDKMKSNQKINKSMFQGKLRTRQKSLDYYLNMLGDEYKEYIIKLDSIKLIVQDEKRTKEIVEQLKSLMLINEFLDFKLVRKHNVTLANRMRKHRGFDYYYALAKQ